MSAPILATKLYMPAPRSRVVPRPRLIERLDAGLDGKLTLISAAAGCGKTTLVSAWAAGCGLPAAWLSLDEGDSDPTRFLTYLIAALQTVAPSVGQGALAALQAPQPPSPEAILTAVLNDIAALPDRLILVLDDYHAIDAPAVDQALAFLLQNLPPPLHLVIATREDPPLPLARLRARGQLTELRAADLRFTPGEAAEFLNQVMGLSLSPAEMAALEARTEGWIAGLHLAALSMQGRTDTAAFVETFSGSHRFVLDYLVEEVLQRQPAGVQDFPAAHRDPRPPVRPIVRCRVAGRLRFRAGHPGLPRPRQPVHRPAGQRTALVPLPPPVWRAAAPAAAPATAD